MKVPQKPRDLKEILKEKDPDKIFGLLEDEAILDFIVKCNQDYVHWDKLRYKKIPHNVDPEKIWALIKIFRRPRYKYFKFDGWNFSYSLLDDSLRKLHLLDKGTAGHLETGLETINVEGKEKYIISSLMEEAIASSQLEGAATTRKIAKKLLRLKKRPRTDSEQMIVNGYNAMQDVVKLKDKVLTPEIILKMQENITKDTLKDKRDEGRFRDNNKVVVADPMMLEKIYHVPPDYKKISKLMEEFCEFANNEDEFMHPILKGIILHFLLGYIHPFNDGNGRTARTIFYWYVLNQGYWLFEYMAVSRIILRSKTKYGLAYLYTETDDNDLTYFINYNLGAIEEALHEMEEYINRKQKEQLGALELIQGLRNINLRQAEILKKMMKNPEKTFTINEIMGTYGVVYQTARSDLLYLEKLGYVDKMQIKRKFVFQASEKRPPGV